MNKMELEDRVAMLEKRERWSRKAINSLVAMLVRMDNRPPDGRMQFEDHRAMGMMQAHINLMAKEDRDMERGMFVHVDVARASMSSR